MNKYLNKPITIVVLLVIFFALTVVISLRYSDNEEGKEKIRQSFWYRGADWGVRQGEKIFYSPEEQSDSATSTTEGENMINNPQDLKENLKRYIKIKKEENGFSIIMQNSEGIFWEKTWQLFPEQTPE